MVKVPEFMHSEPLNLKYTQSLHQLKTYITVNKKDYSWVIPTTDRNEMVGPKHQETQILSSTKLDEHNNCFENYGHLVLN